MSSATVAWHACSVIMSSCMQSFKKCRRKCVAASNPRPKTGGGDGRQKSLTTTDDSHQNHQIKHKRVHPHMSCHHRPGAYAPLSTYAIDSSAANVNSDAILTLYSLLCNCVRVKKHDSPVPAPTLSTAPAPPIETTQPTPRHPASPASYTTQHTARASQPQPTRVEACLKRFHRARALSPLPPFNSTCPKQGPMDGQPPLPSGGTKI